MFFNTKNSFNNALCNGFDSSFSASCFDGINYRNNFSSWKGVWLSRLDTIVSVLVFVSILYLGHYLFVLSHERIHQQVNTNNGIDSEIVFNTFGLFAQTIPDTNCSDRDLCLRLIEQQSLVETIGYTAYPFFILFLTAFDTIFVVWLANRKVF